MHILLSMEMENVTSHSFWLHNLRCTFKALLSLFVICRCQHFGCVYCFHAVQMDRSHTQLQEAHLLINQRGLQHLDWMMMVMMKIAVTLSMVSTSTHSSFCDLSVLYYYYYYPLKHAERLHFTKWCSFVFTSLLLMLFLKQGLLILA